MAMAYTIETTKYYDKWFKKLKDSLVRIKILARLSRVENENFGDFKQLGANLYELRLFFWLRLENLLCHQRQESCSSAGGRRQIQSAKRHQQSLSAFNRNGGLSHDFRDKTL